MVESESEEDGETYSQNASPEKLNQSKFRQSDQLPEVSEQSENESESYDNRHSSEDPSESEESESME